MARTKQTAKNKQSGGSGSSSTYTFANGQSQESTGSVNSKKKSKEGKGNRGGGCFADLVAKQKDYIPGSPTFAQDERTQDSTKNSSVPQALIGGGVRARSMSKRKAPKPSAVK